MGLGEVNQILDLPGVMHNGAAWLRRFVGAMRAVGADHNCVAAVLSFESRFDPHAVNKYSGAYGLIQWTKDGAASQGLTLAQIQRLDAYGQLALVADWYGRHNKASWRPIDYYLAVFAPSAIGKPGQQAVYSAPSNAWAQNCAAFDACDRGAITVSDVSNTFLPLLSAARAKPRLTIGAAWPRLTIGLGVGIALTGGGLYLARRYHW